MPGKLYLIPNFIGIQEISSNFPSAQVEIIQNLKHFFVENPKPARHFLKVIHPQIDFQTIHIHCYDKHNLNHEDEVNFIQGIMSGLDGGIISDSGCPGIADPGSSVIRKAHELNIEVIPLIGPSSILLTLMSSGLNGQNFWFKGYLPRNKEDRIKSIRNISGLIQKENVTILFIETPYRTQQLMNDLLQELPSHLYLCIGTNLYSNNQFISSKPISFWKKNIKSYNLDDKLVVFAIGQ